MLSDAHYHMLSVESGISDEVIRARGYETITEDATLRALGFAPAQCRAPGLLLPLWTVDGEAAQGSRGEREQGREEAPLGERSPLHPRTPAPLPSSTPLRPCPPALQYVYRPDNPRVHDDKRRGKLPDGTYRQRVIKYEQPQGQGTRLDCPPTCRPLLADPSVPLFITEGQKKADALASRGACAVALLGVWNFKGKNDFGGTTLLADFDYIALDNRAVYLVFDSDVMSKTGVRAALERLTEHLQRKRAAVRVIYLPRLAGGKTGVDDWLVATGEGLDELMALAEGPRPEQKAAAPLTTLLDLAPNRLSRPLKLIDGRAYAATWAWVQTVTMEKVNRQGVVVRLDPPQVNVEERLMLLRDDGVVFGDGGDRPMAEAGVIVALAEKVPPGMRLSTAALQAYRNGYRPDPLHVFGRIRDVVDRFIDFDRLLADQQVMAEMIACYIMATWFLDAFTVAGFLWPNGDRGSGKTQLLAVICELAYLGQLVLAGGSFAALRDLADYGATLAFDDAENLSDPRRTDPDKRTLLLAGNRKGNNVPLKEKVENGWQLRYINTFSFRLFSATHLPDPILASRTIIVPLIRTPDRYRANADPMDFTLWPHDRQKLVDDLWLLALAHLPELATHEAAVNARSTLTGRNLEPWRALLAVAGWLDEAQGSFAAQGSRGACFHPCTPAPLLPRMMALSEAYQTERPNVETANLTGLVIRALGMVVGKMVRDDSGISDVSGVSGVSSKKGRFVMTSLITAAAQTLVDPLEIDIDPDHLTSRRIGRTLKKMRFAQGKQPNGGQRGWVISLEDLYRWAQSYGVDLEEITGVHHSSHIYNAANAANVDNAATIPFNRLQGEI